MKRRIIFSFTDGCQEAVRVVLQPGMDLVHGNGLGDDALAAKLIARRESDREKVLAKDAALTASLAAQQ